ncbi:hypothetical protein BKA70DRAFT_1514781 [Coprinopsis sp. MPI-PUGE-AT-0042]|nr:hypothetical protein BKA70DRAFT_1514781 [Coprinopsis sp. MPI-PUGE-AT-0042]
MVISNNWVLNAPTTPLFFLWLQCAIASLLFHLGDAFNCLTAKAMLLATILSVLSLSFSKYTLQYVDASFYQTKRGLFLPFAVATSLSSPLLSRPFLPILFACVVVTVDFFVGVFVDAVSVSVIGVSFGVAPLSKVRLLSLSINPSQFGINKSSLALGWYMNAGSTLLLLLLLLPILLLAGEAPGILSLLFYSRGGIDDSNPGRLNALQTFLYGSLITGVLGFLICVSSLLSIKLTSPITHMASSAVRGVAASSLGLYVFHDLITISALYNGSNTKNRKLNKPSHHQTYA